MTDYLIGAVDDIPEGKGRAFQAGARTIAVFRAKGKFHAMADRCLHRGASISQGEIVEDGALVRCPLHNWAFELTTGEHRLDRRERQRCFPVRIENGQIILTA